MAARHMQLLSWPLLASALRTTSFLSASTSLLPLSHQAPARARAVTALASTEAEDSQADVIVIGSGVGGLSAACLLARYGMKVQVMESHEHAGGAAHSFTRGGFTFDSGPSLWSGMAEPSMNPLRQVLDAVEEDVEWCRYDGWGMVLPQGSFYFKVGDAASWRKTLREFGGADAIEQWDRFMRFASPVISASGATSPMALRSDLGAILSLARCFRGFISAAPHARFLNGRLSALIEASGLRDSFIIAWLDYLAFALSGLDSRGTLGAAVAFTLGDLYRPGALLDYPLGGSGAVIEAMVRGIEKYGGSLRTRAHVDEILVDQGGRAHGVRLRSGEEVRARVAVISNADAAATVRMLPSAWRPLPKPERGGALNTALELTPSFMHLHIGFRGGDDLPPDLGIHYSVILDSFEEILLERNMVIISIPTLLDPSLAPPGQHTLHAYLAADEPFEPWENLDRRSEEYKKLKEERAEVLWTAVEKIIPDIRERVVVEMVGTPLTHERFLRRTRGSYGPSLFSPSGDTIPFAKTHIDSLLHCGDSCFPGIGVPSAAATGMNAANTLVSPKQQIELMDWLDERGCLAPKPSSVL